MSYVASLLTTIDESKDILTSQDYLTLMNILDSMFHHMEPTSCTLQIKSILEKPDYRTILDRVEALPQPAQPPDQPQAPSRSQQSPVYPQIIGFGPMEDHRTGHPTITLFKLNWSSGGRQ